MAIRYPMTLSITEPNNDVGLIKARQGDENAIVFGATITENGQRKPFNGLTPFFCLMPRTLTGQGLTEEPLTVFNATNATLEYTLSENALQTTGRNEAYFSFRKENSDGTWVEQFSTRSFMYTVEKGIYTVVFRDSNYWWTFKELYQKFQKWVQDNRDIIESIDPNGTILSELIDSRGDYRTLADRLNEMSDTLADVGAGVFEPTLHVKAIFYAAMDSIQQSVTQSFCIRSDSTIYNIQSNITNPPDADRHATINRLNRAGLLLDSMEIIHSGHGANWQLIEGTPDKFLITAVKGDEVRFAIFSYVPNGRIDIFDNEDVQYIPSLNNADVPLSLDLANDQIAVAKNDSDGNWEKIDIYSYSDFTTQGLQAEVKYSVMIDVTTLQGHQILDGKLYIYNSTISESGASDATITIMNIDGTAQETYFLDDLGLDPQATENQLIEGEGMCVWKHPETDEVSIFVGVATGQAGGSKRVTKLYGWHTRNNYYHFSNIFNEKVQSQKIFDGDGYSLTRDQLPESLKEVNKVGEWYFNGTQIQTFNDLPAEYDLGTSGYWVKNYSKNKGGVFRQELIRNNGDFLQTFTRLVDERNKTASDWRFNDTSSDRASKPGQAITALSDLKSSGSYYLNTQEWQALTDVPQDPKLGWGTSGFFINVSKKSGDGTFIQEAVRNTSTDRKMKLVRSIIAGTSPQEWMILSDTTYVTKNPAVTKLSDLRVEGQFVFDGAVFGALTDAPTDTSIGIGSSSYWVENAMVTDGNLIQKCYRNNLTIPVELFRVVRSNGTTSKWFRAGYTEIT